MSKKRNFSDDEIEIIDVDLMDIEDRAREEIVISVNEIIPVAVEYEALGEEFEDKAISETLVNDEDADGKVEETKKESSDIVYNIIRMFLMFIAVGTLVFCGYKLAEDWVQKYLAGKLHAGYVEQYSKKEPLADEDALMADGSGINTDFIPSQIDWPQLVAINGEIYAWIEFESPDLNINYPVAHSRVSNEYYLKRTVNGTENSSGSIYIDKGIDPHFGYVNTIIYGHNMRNGTMFGNLKKYKDASYYEGREYFWIYTPESRNRYEIFACYETGESSSTYSWWSAPCDEYTAYLENSKASSIYDMGVELEPDDKIVTLSTCTSSDTKRLIVQAKLVYTETK